MLTPSSKQRRQTKGAYGHAPQPHTVATNERWLLHLRSSTLGTLTLALHAPLYPRTIKVHENKSCYQTLRLSVPSALYPIHLRFPIWFLDQIPWLQHLERAAHSAFLLQAVLLSSCPGPIFLNAHYYLSRSALSPGCYHYLPGFTMLRQAPIIVFWVISLDQFARYYHSQSFQFGLSWLRSNRFPSFRVTSDTAAHEYHSHMNETCMRSNS